MTIRHFQWRAVLAFAAVAASAFGPAGRASANTVAVSGFDAAYTANGQWYVGSQTAGGAASVVSVAGAGGNLQGNVPSGSGAALLTTDNTNAAKIEVSVSDNYGTASQVLSGLSLSYDYYRFNAAGQNAAAAPSIKLTFYNPAYATHGDGYVTLVYEPYLQTPALTNPASNVWTPVNIDFNNGLFWENGGFGQASGAGGPPLNTLSGWLSTFDSSTPDGGFGAASLLAVTMGLGSYNPGVTGYFDDVTIGINGSSTTYDFEAAAAVPEPANLALFGIGLAAMGIAARRRKSA